MFLKDMAIIFPENPPATSRSRTFSRTSWLVHVSTLEPRAWKPGESHCVVGKIDRKDRFDNENMWKKTLFPVDVPFYQFWDWFMAVYGFWVWFILNSWISFVWNTRGKPWNKHIPWVWSISWYSNPSLMVFRKELSIQFFATYKLNWCQLYAGNESGLMIHNG